MAERGVAALGEAHQPDGDAATLAAEKTGIDPGTKLFAKAPNALAAALR
jgi:hypothetical protein